jgi:hypothetical protein
MTNTTGGRFNGNTFVGIDPGGTVAAYQCFTPNPPQVGGAAEKICLARTDGTLENRLTEPDAAQFCCPSITSAPFVAGAAHLVPFTSNDGDLVPGESTTSFEIYLAEVNTALALTGLERLTLTPFPDVLDKFTPRISENGAVIAFLENANRQQNGGFVPVSRLVAINSDGSGRTELTDFEHQAGDPVLSADGQKIVFSFTGDPTGGNADANPEIFLRRDGGGVMQLTDTPAAEVQVGKSSIRIESFFPYVDPTGRFVVFQSNADPTGGNPDHNREIFVIALGED